MPLINKHDLSPWTRLPFAGDVLGPLFDFMVRMGDVHLEIVTRPGVSTSFRPRRAGQKERPLFAIVDVIEDPEGDWLSVCFYADTVTDPLEHGDLIPSGLLGEDATCFDVATFDPGHVAYLVDRLREAHTAALP